jgi:hypothetical protein
MLLNIIFVIAEKIKPLQSLTVGAFRVFSAVRMGLEPTTSAVTGQHSNQLNYRTIHSRKDISICVIQKCSPLRAPC